MEETNTRLLWVSCELAEPQYESWTWPFSAAEILREEHRLEFS